MSPQQTIAHYRITAKLGEGGMGEVWRATDTKLGREVAIKILPAAFADDTDRLARFQREAQVLASLNHPNIAHIYGVEERALVMELVEGESPKGPLPFEDAWKIALQIADALEYAHEPGGNSSGSEAGQCEGHARWSGEAARFRIGEGVQRNAGRSQFGPGELADRHSGRDRGRNRDRHSSVHGPGAGQGQARR